ncbi:MAG: hypothetical protein C6P37_00300 [Caldibacillus debilis]|uniref:Uncharacterized protein n=1 Tax=Caldibacillus debilis TaxID=301148 RepID=A0A3E0K8T6_9BACI|nr:hypothetical protein [Bacillaceae bacterium]OUM89786.1 MAG: hypothetical protein BAA03_04665 [Caldibacillus debilis]MBY6270909.1 hypothetical protein [Bacillaceae bacterium]REJ14604.1 MAG: hypothetical protein C6W57_13465 [Caldibacillus debilis]REJ26418.1 MAG: hypothetical protein C6W56_11920 [Caldibacillus debilis]
MGAPFISVVDRRTKPLPFLRQRLGHSAANQRAGPAGFLFLKEYPGCSCISFAGIRALLERFLVLRTGSRGRARERIMWDISKGYFGCAANNVFSFRGNVECFHGKRRDDPLQ